MFKLLLQKACYLGDSAEAMKQWAKEGNIEEYKQSMERLRELLADLDAFISEDKTERECLNHNIGQDVDVSISGLFVSPKSEG